MSIGIKREIIFATAKSFDEPADGVVVGLACVVGADVFGVEEPVVRGAVAGLVVLEKVVVGGAVAVVSSIFVGMYFCPNGSVKNSPSSPQIISSCFSSMFDFKSKCT